MTSRNNHVFKGHKTLLGNKFVTYGEVELPLRYDIFAESKNGFDWGYTGSAPKQLAFSILCQVSNENIAKSNAIQFSNEIIKTLNSRDWILNASDVIKWIEKNNQEELVQEVEPLKTAPKKIKKQKTNIVKNICKELEITQKNLAEILEVPEGTVSSWAVKNEIPRLGKKAIEFYILNKKNQDIVNSYKSFVHLLNAS